MKKKTLAAIACMAGVVGAPLMAGNASAAPAPITPSGSEVHNYSEVRAGLITYAFGKESHTWSNLSFTLPSNGDGVPRGYISEQWLGAFDVSVTPDEEGYGNTAYFGTEGAVLRDGGGATYHHDFSKLSGGVLPKGSIVFLQDIDVNYDPHMEGATITSDSAKGAFLDYAKNGAAPGHSGGGSNPVITYDADTNTYEATPTGDNDEQRNIFITTQDLKTLDVHLSGRALGNGAGDSVGVAAPLTPYEDPKASPDEGTTPYNTPLRLNVLDNDTLTKDGNLPMVRLIDPSNGESVTEFTAPEGSYRLEENVLIFTPKEGFVGKAPAISYRVTQGNLESAESTAQVTVLPPVPASAQSDSVKTPYNTSVTIDALSNDKAGDAPFDTSTLTVQGEDASQGTWTVQDGKVRFTPVRGFAGTARATYKVKNEKGVEVTDTITVTVENNAEQPAPTTSPTTTPQPQPSESSTTPQPSESSTTPSPSSSSSASSPSSTATPTKSPSSTATPTPAPTSTPVTQGPLIQTDLDGNGALPVGVFGVSAMVIAGGAVAALRRRK